MNIVEFLHQPAPSKRLGDYLHTNFLAPWTHFRAAVAFVKQSGTKHIFQNLAYFSSKGSVEIITGIDHLGTSSEGLQDLLSATSPNGRIVVFHNRLRNTFHPKIYLFRNATKADIIIGSGNLTEGGLFTNYEASIRLELDLSKSSHVSLLSSVENTLDAWANPAKGIAHQLNTKLLARLVALGLVPLEGFTDSENNNGTAGVGGAKQGSDEESPEPASPFAALPEPRAPAVPKQKQAKSSQATKPTGSSISPGTVAPGAGVPKPALIPLSAGSSARGFVITLQRTDVGVGQTSTGTSRRSPELFIPLAARNANPKFWGWPDLFVADPDWGGPTDRDGYGKMDRTGVRLRLGTTTFNANLWYNPNKKDIRIRTEVLRSAGNIDDILRMENAAPGSGFDYYVEIVPQGTTQHPVYKALCTTQVRNSLKTFGYY